MIAIQKQYETHKTKKLLKKNNKTTFLSLLQITRVVNKKPKNFFPSIASAANVYCLTSPPTATAAFGGGGGEKRGSGGVQGCGVDKRGVFGGAGTHGKADLANF